MVNQQSMVNRQSPIANRQSPIVNRRGVSMKKKARAHVIIKGRVQGVFFRVNTARAANRLGVFGWVKNRWDGNVEAVFEGEEDRVNAILEWCDTGDAPAKVLGVDLEWEEFTGAYNSFDITY